MIVLAKLLGSLLYPLSLALLMLLVAVALWRRRAQLARVLATGALGWLWLWSTPWLAERAAVSLERIHPPVLASDLPNVDAIVLLGGLLTPSQAPDTPYADLNGAADRAWFAARLWHAGKAPIVVCTGGLAPLSRASAPECPEVVGLLRDMGVPDSALRVESASRTTAENASKTRTLLADGDRVLLVTSARHMPRALEVFQREGIGAIAAPTDHQWRPGRLFTLADLLPSPAALALSTTVWHEWLGRVWYRIGGG